MEYGERRVVVWSLESGVPIRWADLICRSLPPWLLVGEPAHLTFSSHAILTFKVLWGMV